MATQLTHLPKLVGYDPRNLLSYIPLYDNDRVSTKKLINASRVYESFFMRLKIELSRSDHIQWL